MLFSIKCTDGSVYYYDNLLNRVYDCFHNLIDFSLEYNTYANRLANTGYSLKNDDYFEYHSEILIRDKSKVWNPKDINRLEITLGYKCNYRCKYCIQHNCHKDTDGFDFNLFCKRFEKSNLLPQLNYIKFTGGEPFVYWDRFTKFVDYFRNLGYNGIFQVTTNGELFDKEKLEYCLKNNIYCFFAHDAYAQTYYRHGSNYLENSKTKAFIIEQLKARQYDFGLSDSGSMTCILNPKVYRIQDGLDYYNRVLYEGVPVTPYLIIKCDSDTEFLLNDWTEEHLIEAKNSIIHAMLCDKSDKYYNYYFRYRELLERVTYRMVNQLPASVQLSRCPMQVSSRALACDYNGDILACWGAYLDKKIVNGTLDKLDNVIFNFKSSKNYPECQSCPYIIACGGCTCPIVSKKDHAIRCKSVMPLISAEMEAVLTLLLGKRVEEIKSCDMTE